ncbi:uncharacterized protein BP5553_02293 [Venustampulla echinocandica]|uniref:Uncharacterized protein n=1 Tax=Venustampulla echinocandica TaxID=2656787 RepID=A0A370U3H1_9HELO|nr:uncharacterized protein BP5553_02293 [Venustampulla echinocandica]RDL42314.1 hypothetical protein BP5553_02293 [Venustampulla echinocandica]
MQFTTFIAASVLATLALATPTPAQEAAAASTPLIDLWQDSGFLGLKFTGSSTVGTCVNLPGTGFQDNVSSGKAKPGFRCTTWV